MSVLWLHRDTTLITVALMMVDGRTLTPPEIAARFPDYPSLKPFRIRRKVLGGHSVTSRRRPYLVTDIRVAPIFQSVVGEAGIDWYLRHGVRQELNVPLVVGDKTVAALSLYLKSRPVVTPAKVARALTLTYQAALALELTQLAEADKAVAVTRERKRAAHLERANAMLSSAIETFALKRSPEAYLDAALHTIAAALQTDSATMWRWPGDGYAHLHRMLEGGIIVSGEHANHPNAGRPAFIADLPWVEEVVSGKMPAIDVVPLEKQTRLTAEQIAHLRARGVRALVTIAICSGNTVIGAFNARLLEDQPDPGPEQLALMRSLAAHTALAMEMGRLTEAARDGAIREERVRLAHERAQAAQERAAELEHVNAVLSSSIEIFAIERSPDAFLDAIMHTIAAALDVSAVAMWSWPGDDHAYLYRVLENGVVLPGEKTDHPNANRPHYLPAFHWVQEALAGNKQVPEVILLNEQSGISAEQIAYLHARGARALIAASIRSGKKVIGTFVAHLPSGKPDPGPERVALMRSLAAHGALAMEMGRLTEAARVGATREERTRIARDLHDSLAQGFTGISMQLEAVVSALASKDLVKARVRAITAGEMARDSLRQARRAVHALRPSILEDRDLVMALKDLVESTFVGSSAETESCFTGASHPLPPEVEEHLLRIAQEALTNAFKHAQARHVGVCLTYGPHEISLKIHDDGQGFDPSHQRPRAHGGLGLVGIRERVQRLGATLTVESEPGKGTGISVVLSTPKPNDRPQPTQT